MRASRSLLLITMPVSCLFALEGRAQIRASERGSVSQTVDGTVITVDYGRVQVRGRDSLFGKVVRKDEVWTPGANAATTFHATRDVTVGGKPLPAGRYSMWMVSDPAQSTLYFHRNAGLFHTQHPKLPDMALAVPVTRSTSTEHVEVLTFDFPRVTTSGAELRLRWGREVVPVEIGVAPSPSTQVAMTPEQMAPYLGTYGLTFVSQEGKRSPERKLAIVNAKGALRGIIDMPGEGMEMQYIPTDTLHRFTPAFVKNGKVVDVETATYMEFKVVDGRAAGFVVIFDGKPWIEAARKD